MRIADLPQRNGINQINVLRNEQGKSLVGMIFDILAQQRAVIRCLHSTVSVRRPAERDNLFSLLHHKHFEVFCREGHVGTANWVSDRLTSRLPSARSCLSSMPISPVFPQPNTLHSCFPKTPGPVSRRDGRPPPLLKKRNCLAFCRKPPRPVCSGLPTTIVVSINIGTNAKPVGLTCWSANPAAQQRRPTTKYTNVVVICYINNGLQFCEDKRIRLSGHRA